MALGLFSGFFTISEVEGQIGVNPLKNPGNYKTAGYKVPLNLKKPLHTSLSQRVVVENYKKSKNTSEKTVVSLIHSKPGDKLKRNYKRVR